MYVATPMQHCRLRYL